MLNNQQWFWDRGTYQHGIYNISIVPKLHGNQVRYVDPLTGAFCHVVSAGGNDVFDLRGAMARARAVIRKVFMEARV